MQARSAGHTVKIRVKSHKIIPIDWTEIDNGSIKTLGHLRHFRQYIPFPVANGADDAKDFGAAFIIKYLYDLRLVRSFKNHEP
jgi:hypothetical protein